MIKKAVKRLANYVIYRATRLLITLKVFHRVHAKKAYNDDFNRQTFRESVISFISSLSYDTNFQYKYSTSCNKPTLYASAYACMTLSLLGKLNDLSTQQKAQWIAYFDSFQDANDGLFYDPVVDSQLYRTADWWGSRHLALHMISAYTNLGGKPKYPFYFLEDYYDADRIKQWLDSHEWSKSCTHADDIDNKIMNIGCLLQYQRDAWNDDRARAAVNYLQSYLLSRINKQTGMWGHFDTNNPDQLSRVVQFAYHLFPLFFYDGIQIQHHALVVEHVLATQNKLGGFGVQINSSACEDMDSIDILIRFSPFTKNHKKEIDIRLYKSLNWILCNQVDDGGFVFRLYERFTYGHSQMSSKPNEGSMLSTWFRVLSIAYLDKHFETPHNFVINRCPGYEF